jgi:hypothetical protein
MVFREYSNMVQSWRKLLPDLEDKNFEGFPNEEIDKSEITDIVCAMRSFENVDKANIEEWLQSDMCELFFQHMTDTDTANAAAKQKGEGGGQSTECVSQCGTAVC